VLCWSEGDREETADEAELRARTVANVVHLTVRVGSGGDAA
jgi:hypothetical protein